MPTLPKFDPAYLSNERVGKILVALGRQINPDGLLSILPKICPGQSVPRERLGKSPLSAKDVESSVLDEERCVKKHSKPIHFAFFLKGSVP